MDNDYIISSNMEEKPIQVFKSSVYAHAYNHQLGGIYGEGTHLGMPEYLPEPLAGLVERDAASLNLEDKKTLARYFYQFNSLAGIAIDINTEVPLSKTKLIAPKVPGDVELSEYIYNFYNSWVANVKLFSRLIEISHEYWLVGECYIWCEYDEKNKIWSKLSLLFWPMDTEVDPVTGEEQIWIKVSAEHKPAFDNLIAEGSISEDSMTEDMEGEGGWKLMLPTDPFKGSFCFHLERKPSDAYDAPVSLLDRVLYPLTLSKLLLAAKESVIKRAYRNKEVFSLKVDGQPAPEYVVDDFEMKIWASYSTPEFPIVCNYDVEYTMIGVGEKAFDIQADLEYLDENVYTGLGFNKSVLQGEAAYSGERISLEIINTRFYMFREVIVDFVEQYLFKPIAYHNGFFVKGVEISPEYLRTRLYKAFLKGDEEDVMLPDSQRTDAKAPKDLDLENVEASDLMSVYEGLSSEVKLGDLDTVKIKSMEKGLKRFNKMSHFSTRRGYGVQRDNYNSSTTLLDVDLKDPFVFWVYPTLSFKRVALTDSAEAFAQIFNLVESGKLPPEFAYDILNIDSEQVHNLIENNRFTSKDPQMTVFMEALYQGLTTTFESPEQMGKLLEALNFPKNVLDIIKNAPTDDMGDGTGGFDEPGEELPE